jgi:hypothetical protein
MCARLLDKGADVNGWATSHSLGVACFACACFEMPLPRLHAHVCRMACDQSRIVAAGKTQIAAGLPSASLCSMDTRISSSSS